LDLLHFALNALHDDPLELDASTLTGRASTEKRT
jgi:hypothetical protein